MSWKARELEILQLLAQGLTNGEIGARLHLAEETVRWYNKQIFAKLQVKSRYQAVEQGQKLGLVPAAEAPKAPLSPPPVCYVANGSVHLAYQVVGNGPVDLLFIHGFLSHLELAWQMPEFAHTLRQCAGSAGLRVALHVGACPVGAARPRPAVLAVALAAAQQAAPGEIVLTQTLRDTLAGAGLALTPKTAAPNQEQSLYTLG